MVNLNFNGGEWQIKYGSCLYENDSNTEITSLSYFPSPVVEIKVKLNEMSLEQSVTSSFNRVLLLLLTMSTHQETAKWILLDWSSLDKRVIKLGSFNKTDFFCEKLDWKQ